MKKYKLAINILFALAILSGCYTENKAERQADKAFKKYPTVIAKIAVKEFPCITSGITYDSSSLSRFNDSLVFLHGYYDSATNAIAAKEQIVDSAPCIANLGVLKRNADRYEAKIRLLNSEIAALYNLTKSPAVIIDTVRKKDSAEADILKKQHSEDQLFIAKLSQSDTDNTRKADKYFWYFITTLFVLGITSGISLYNKIKNL